MQLSKSWSLVTGGGSGAGKASAQYLAAKGSKVLILDKDDGAHAVAKEIDGVFIKCDVSSDKEVEGAFEALVSQGLPLSVVLNCAGIAPPARMTGKDGAKPLSLFQKVININLVGTYNVMRLAASVMSSQSPDEHNQRGVIINTASIAAYEGQIGQTAYSASKAGIVGMTLPAARELAQFGIRVMTIAPGLLDTAMLQGLPGDYRQALEENTPFPKRFGKVEEFASLVGHIVDNTMLNGEVIRLDGALRMSPT